VKPKSLSQLIGAAQRKKARTEFRVKTKSFNAALKQRLGKSLKNVAITKPRKQKTVSKQVFAKEVHIPKRAMIPEGVLPWIWEHALESAANDAIESVLRGHGAI